MDQTTNTPLAIEDIAHKVNTGWYLDNGGEQAAVADITKLQDEARLNERWKIRPFLMRPDMYDPVKLLADFDSDTNVLMSTVTRFEVIDHRTAPRYLGGRSSPLTQASDSATRMTAGR